VAADRNETPVREVLQDFLWAGKFPEPPAKHFPRLHRMFARGRWKIETLVGNFLHERGLDTASSEVEVDHFHPDRTWYAPSGWSYLKRVLPRNEISATDVFIDFGSGKGRVLVQAAQYPFARVIGVEISPTLNETARANLDRKRGTLTCERVELVTCDVASYDIPDDLTVAYFFYPFVGDTFKRVIENIVASIERRPRRVRIIYALPRLEAVVLETGRFVLTRSARIAYGTGFHRISLYTSVESSV
jgi:methyltransferase family protein